MKDQIRAIWFRAITVILILFGLLFFFFGLRVFSTTIPLIPRAALLPWESALYGAVVIGWGATILLVGRIALRRKDGELSRALLVGLAIWLVLEALASAWFGIWLNVGVDAAVLTLFAIPLSRPRGT